MHDADEVGTQWISQIADVLRQEVPKDIPLIAIGHSFGARALASALCGLTPWRQLERPERKWESLIAWQGAFSLKRFTKSGSLDGFAYEHACLDRVSTIVATASKHDSAVDSAIWVGMAGSFRQWKARCIDQDPRDDLASVIHCLSAEETVAGSLPELKLRRGYLNYVDASNIVYFSHPNTGGGAHSDIFRGVHGVLNWRAMNVHRQ